MSPFKLQLASLVATLFVVGTAIPFGPLSSICYWSSMFMAIFFKPILGKRFAIFMYSVYLALQILTWVVIMREELRITLFSAGVYMPTEVLRAIDAMVVFLEIVFCLVLWFLFEFLIEKLKLRQRVGLVR